ncbi:hypothetical protein E2562_028793 [Oryza meyeriana var. granulata]|uniref:Myb-like domain-containing protein n=1 Tax=Oryza meyeriana var. granulata TaxID=110450 RepID=A0A6G1EBN6_9ORYZ|nr:hypothetical protein E2562_028793 [Oryza meyeriana var. granulata]
MYYSVEEDIRLLSAWINNPTNPIEGVSRKGETYWTKVAESYNATTPPGRKRDANCLKGHWHKTSKKVAFFNGCNVQLKDTYVSGRSGNQLMQEALELYWSRAKGKQFAYVHWWKPNVEDVQRILPNKDVI